MRKIDKDWAMECGIHLAQVAETFLRSAKKLTPADAQEFNDQARDLELAIKEFRDRATEYLGN
jgi:hypothetical protein